MTDLPGKEHCSCCNCFSLNSGDVFVNPQPSDPGVNHAITKIRIVAIVVDEGERFIVFRKTHEPSYGSHGSRGPTTKPALLLRTRFLARFREWQRKTL